MNLLRALFVVAALAACQPPVDSYVSDCTTDVACTCDSGLHGFKACSIGQASAACVCTVPVAPQIVIQGNPQSLSAGASYSATVVATNGLVHDWSITGGALTSAARGESVNFNAGNAGLLLLTVNTTNAGGDAAPPTTTAVSVVAPPPTLATGDVLVATTLTTGRAGVSASVVSPQAGITYAWRVEGDATVAPATGAGTSITTGAVGVFSLFVKGVNTAGIASNEFRVDINVLPQQVELLAGTVGGLGHLDGAKGDNRLAQPVGLAAGSGGAALYIADAANVFDDTSIGPTVRTMQASGTLSTLVALPTAVNAGPLLSVTPGAGSPYLLLGDTSDSEDGSCGLYQVALGASPSAAAFGDDPTDCGACVTDPDYPNSAIIALTQLVSGAVYGTDGTTIFALSAGAAAAPVLGADACDGSGTANIGDDIVGLAPAGTKLLVVSQQTPGTIELLNLATGTAVDLYDHDPQSDNDVIAAVPDGSGNYFVVTAREVLLLPASRVSAPNPTAALSVVAGSDSAPVGAAVDGDDDSANFVAIAGAYYAGGVLYLSDDNLIRTVQPDANKPASYAVATLSGVDNHIGDADKEAGATTPAAFNMIDSVAIDSHDQVFLVDTPHDASAVDPAQSCKIKRFNASGAVTTIAGSGCGGYLNINGRALTSQLGNPKGLALDASGTLVYGDVANYLLREVTTSGLLLTEAGATQTSQPSAIADGFVSSAVFVAPHAMAFSSDGILAVADFSGYVRLVLDNQVVTPVANQSCDGSDPTCPISITGIAFDLQGDIILNDNVKGVLQMSVPDYIGSAIVSRTDCTGAPQPSEPCDSACLSDQASGIAIEPLSGDIFVGEGELLRRIHRDATSCTVTTVTGTPGNIGVRPGPLANATFNRISSLAISPLTGDLYVADGEEGILTRVRY